MSPRHPAVYDGTDDKIIKTRVARKTPVAERALRINLKIGGRQTLTAIRAENTAVEGLQRPVIANITHNTG